MAHNNLLTVGEVADLLGVAPQTLYRWRKSGYGPKWVQLGPKTIRYLASDQILMQVARAAA